MQKKNYKWISNKLHGIQIKTRIFLYVIILFLPTIIKGQEFSFNLFFEDAAGNKDTIVLGYDEAATDGIDEAFGEDDIKNAPFSKAFEVRISDSWRIFYFPIPFLTKKQITSNICEQEIYCTISSLLIKCDHFPIIVKWDKSFFTDVCRIQSLITDWHPGSWFDAGVGTEQGPFYLKDIDSVKFTHTTEKYFHDINGITDTLNFLFTTIASDKNLIVGLENYKIHTIKVSYNNPTYNILNIESEEGNIISVVLYDIFERNVLVSAETDAIDVSRLSTGLYIIKINFDDYSLTDKLLIVK